MEVQKRQKTFWLTLVIFSLIGQVAWVVENMYLNVFIYNEFNAFPGDISAMVAASAVTATLTTVFMGALSDRIGKRKVFMCSGYLLWGISIFGFVLLKKDILSAIFTQATSVAAVGITLTIGLDCLMTFFGSTANDAAFNAWLTDTATPSNRGKAEGINAMMPLVSILLVSGGLMFFDLEQSSSWTVIFSVIGALVLCVGALGFFLIKEPPVKPSETPYFKGIIYGFRPRTVKENRVLYTALLAFVIFNISIQIFMPYLILYYEKALGMKNYVPIMAPAIILASVFTFFQGKLYDKKGFSFTAKAALAALILGYVLLYAFRATALVFVGSLLMMTGYLAGMAAFGAVIRDHTPQGKAGRLQGVRIFAQVLLPGVIGPYIGKWVLKDCEVVIGDDGTASFVPNHQIFLAAAIAAMLVPFLIFVVEKIQKRQK